LFRKLLRKFQYAKVCAAKMKMGQEHGKEHLFEHVDALLVSGFGWDSSSICVEIVFI